MASSSQPSSPTRSIRSIGPLLTTDRTAEDTFNAVKEDVRKKIWELHRKDVVHNLNEVWKLENCDKYDVVSYRIEEVPYGVNYYGKVQMNSQGDCIHVRVYRPAEGKGPIKFHSIQTRPSEEGGAVFTLEEPLRPFEY